MRHARTLALLATAALAAPLLSGCGAEKVAGVDVAKAAEATAAKGTARITMTFTADGFGLPSKVTLIGKGVTSLREPKADLTFDLSDLLGIAGVLTGTDLRVRFDGGALYVDPPDIPTLDIPDGWLAVDLRKAVAALGIDPDAAAALFKVDTASLLQALKAAGRLKKVGHEKIGGVATTHYKGAYSTDDLLAPLPQAQRDAAKKALDAIDKLSDGGHNGDRTPVEMWVDARSIVRKLHSMDTVYTGSGVVAGRMDFTCELSDFGAALDASRPDDVTDVTDKVVEVLKAQGG